MIKKKISHSTCCVVNCKNNGRNSQCTFYSFPKARYKVDQREKWIAALKRINPDGSPWHPKPSNSICSAHFIGNQKSNDPLNPSYTPTIFPSIYRTKVVNEASKINRHARFMERRRKKTVLPSSEIIKTRPFPIEIKSEQLQDQSQEQIMIDPLNFTTVKSEISKYVDKECQAHVIFDSIEPQKTFVCNRYIYNSFFNDVEIQTEIIETTRKIIVPSQKKFKDKKCGTPQKTYVDQSLEPILIDDTTELNFCEFLTVKSEN